MNRPETPGAYKKEEIEGSFFYIEKTAAGDRILLIEFLKGITLETFINIKNVFILMWIMRISGCTGNLHGGMGM